MYERYYGLKKQPFSLIPDPSVVFMSETHQEAMAVLRYGVLSGKGFLVLTGDVGTGKTTLLQALVASLDSDVHCCMISNPLFSRDEFFFLLADRFGIGYGNDKARFLIDFGHFLIKCREQKERALLIIDEAHVMPIDLLEEVRLLSNQDASVQELFSIFLVGQPELNDRMLDSRFLPLRQRVGMRFHLEPFVRKETTQYIQFRLRQAGASRLNIFTLQAIDKIHEASKGTPRLINSVCDYALLSGFSANLTVIGPEVIRECVNELHLRAEAVELPVAVAEDTPHKSRSWRYVVALVLIIAAILLVLEVLPPLRRYSPLTYMYNEGWLQWLYSNYTQS
jgi:general secretion pathway protein A